MLCPNCKAELVEKGTVMQCPKCVYSITMDKPVALSKISRNDAINKANDWITQMLVEAKLGNGLAPWQEQWIMVPKQNWDTGYKYKGINVFILPPISDYFITEERVKKLGAKPKPGARTYPVFRWIPPRFIKGKERQDMLAQGMSEKEIDGKERRYPVLRVFWEYPANMVDGLPEKKRKEVGEKPNKKIETVEQWIEKYLARTGVKLIIGGSQPAYSQTKDEIYMPSIERFNNSDEYYKAVLHEIGHSTAHPKRLDRYNKPKDIKARELEYGKEELVAEMTCAYLAHYFGVKMTDNNGSYLDNWIKAIKADANLIISASSKAEKAIEYLLPE